MPSQAIIYVIDASDVARLPTSRTELLTMLSEEELKNVPVLVFANKQVRPVLNDLRSRNWELNPTLNLLSGRAWRPAERRDQRPAWSGRRREE